MSSPRAYGAAAFGLALGGLVAPGATAGPQATCVRATLSGDATAVAQVANALAQLGVSASGGAGLDASCRSIAATVVTDDRGLAVAIVDPVTHVTREGRVVSDAQVAATWIDSWLRDDFDDAATTAANRPTAKPTQVATLDGTPDGDGEVRDHGEPTAHRPAYPTFASRLSLGVVGERAYTATGGGWDGVAASACVHVGRLCLGARVRGAWQPASAFGNGVVASRRDLSALAMASTSIAARQFVISPELGLGVGRIETDRAQVCHQPQPPECTMGGPPRPECSMTPSVVACSDPDAVAQRLDSRDRVATTGLRASAGVHVALPLFAHVWLDGHAGVELAPFRAASPWQPRSDLPYLPREPLAEISVGLGLHVGAP